jgi:hypothetical protein
MQSEDDSESLAISGIETANGKEQAFGAENIADLRQLEFTARSDSRHSSPALLPKNFLVTEKWHGPYAHALMETDLTRRAPLIVEAEHAIFNRYLELCQSPGPIEHSRDLQNATGVLRNLKNSVALRRPNLSRRE